MKKSLKTNLAFAGLSLFFSVAANAQWLPNGTSNIYNSNTGNVGIGTGTAFNALEKLQVTGGNVLLDYLGTGTTGNLYIGGKTNSNVNGLRFCYSNASGTTQGAYIDVKTASSTEGIRFRVDNANGTTERMRINANGNVGIGTATPTFAKLEVKNSEVNNSADAIPAFSIQKHTGTAARRLFMVPHLYASGYNQLSRTDDFGIFWTDGINGGGQNSTGGLVIAPWGSNAGIRITKDGNVGIGTSLENNPNTYKLAVNGTIGARELKIEISSTTWADFVFEKEYKLMPLAEVEKYVNKNKHLPAIPSAKDVEDGNGINIGEMQTKLLQKVEELTLYIIQIEKDKEALLKRVEALEK